jgi:spore maturation protein CgeB
MLPAGRFVVAGPQYPTGIHWPANVERITHLSPSKHRAFYNSQRFTLNLTRAAMVRAGFSPSVRLFEAAACGTPIISDDWPGLSTLFRAGEEIFVVKSACEVLEILQEIPEHTARDIGSRARERVLREHTSAHRAAELEAIIAAARGRYAASITAGVAALEENKEEVVL